MANEHCVRVEKRKNLVWITIAGDDFTTPYSVDLVEEVGTAIGGPVQNLFIKLVAMTVETDGAAKVTIKVSEDAGVTECVGLKVNVPTAGTLHIDKHPVGVRAYVDPETGKQMAKVVLEVSQSAAAPTTMCAVFSIERAIE